MALKMGTVVHPNVSILLPDYMMPHPKDSNVDSYQFEVYDFVTWGSSS
jgi:hypothetical protein